MTEQAPAFNKENKIAEPSSFLWSQELEVVVCERCHWRSLVFHGAAQRRCPNCHSKSLSVLPGGLAEMPYPSAPELLLPFQLDRPALAKAIQDFRDHIPFAPGGLNLDAMLSRMEKVYLPVWLIDTDAVACWEAEAGFDYQVLSHQDFFDQDAAGWQSREIKEDRVRWENRVGKLNRFYKNITAPATHDHARMAARLGPFRQDSALAYEPHQTDGAWIRLPDNPPNEAWPEAAAVLQKTAAAECGQACGADHVRQFRWKADFSNCNWTLMLLPVFSTCYLDDAGHALSVLINGQTGKISGARQASMKRAGMWSFLILAVSLLTFLAGLLLDWLLATIYPRLVGFSTMIMIMGFLGTFAAAIPYLVAWDFNRKQETKSSGET